MTGRMGTTLEENTGSRPLACVAMPRPAAMTPRVIAEVGCNHKGDLALAKRMIETAAVDCGADVVKFQKRTPRELLSPAQFDAPHPNPRNSYGATYGAHREALEFTLDAHRELRDHCGEFGVEYSTSVWDATSAREIAVLAPALVKVPSATNLRFDVLDLLCGLYGGEIHLSFGMTSHAEEERIVEFFEARGRAKDLVLYACTSGYPVAFGDLCLFEIGRLRSFYGERVKAIGFSGHHLGTAPDVAALALGAEWIERHFTLDRAWKGTDHAASLEPDDFRRLVRDLRDVSLALTGKSEEILPVERVQRAKLKA